MKIKSLFGNYSSSEDFQISGFGKFCVKDKRERRGLNPAFDGTLYVYLEICFFDGAKTFLSGVLSEFYENR